MVRRRRKSRESDADVFYVKKGRIYVFYPGGLNFDVNVQTTINNLLPTYIVQGMIINYYSLTPLQDIS